ncbi:MAG: SDR family oxidoreductase [Ktedonobacteraceae bacterium]|nr:SDR family oxidoreductase [Ktedonobacteraceae bacterium]
MGRYTVGVTGAAGIVGTRLVQQLLRAGYAVHAFVHSRPPAGHALYQKDVTLTVMDFANAKERTIHQCLEMTRPIALLHCAAWVDVAGCERDPERAYLVNTQVTSTLASICAEKRIHVILISTEYVFDGTLAVGKTYLEHDVVHALNHYGKSKVQAEMAVREACELVLSPWTICRTAVLYGSTRQSRPDFPQWLRTQLGGGKTVQIATDLISSPTHAVDLALMLVTIVKYQLQGVYHTAGTTAVNRYQFALLVARHYQLDETLIQPIHSVELGVLRPPNVGLCVDKISMHTGRRPLSVQDGLAYCSEMEEAEALLEHA